MTIIVLLLLLVIIAFLAIQQKLRCLGDRELAELPDHCDIDSLD